MKNISFKLIFPLLLISVISSCSKDEKEIPDTTPPEVSLTFMNIPETAAGETPVVSTKIDIEINADDAKGIKLIEVFLNDVKMAEDDTPPFKFSIDLSEYESKTSKIQNKTQQYYTLKVTATDNSGNKNSCESEIIIDNSLPTISEFSLEEGTIINGDEFPISFKMEDNQGITDYTISLDGNPVEITVEGSLYTLNLKTTTIQDGEHSIFIIAKDAAGNTAELQQKFIVDNTGPELEITGLTEYQLLDSLLTFTGKTTDQYSEIESVELILNDTVIFKPESLNQFTYEMEAENYRTGMHSLEIKCTDALGNASVNSYSIDVKRVLFKLKVTPDYFSNNRTDALLFASRMDGSLISEMWFNNGDDITLHAPGEFDSEEEYMITFFVKNPNSGFSIADNYTLYGITRKEKRHTVFKKRSPMYPQLKKNYELTGFGVNETFRSGALDHNGIMSDGQFLLSTYKQTEVAESDFAFLILNPYGEYYYSKLKKPLDPSKTSIDRSEFSNENVDYAPVSMPGINESLSARMYGFTNETAYLYNQYHLLYHNSITMGQLPYVNDFFKYRTEIYLSEYKYEHQGLPHETYTLPDWSLEYNINGKNIQLTITGQEHEIGKVIISEYLTEVSQRYDWKIVFNSQTKSNIVLPELPESLKEFEFYSFFENNTLNIFQAEITDFSDLNGFADYLDKIFTAGAENHHLISDEVKTLYQVNSGKNAGRYIGEGFPF
ncbi:Ig-like domain-containing protein [Robertkochia solimangrovi]|uniref:Ig-like domain-containing protein n=1 Tax=Robertkochia solimangrovi TaxID=2213046 RepID=UPI00117C501A|nr:Ig-like domain-containing protein [Robertkochia solimangrovi]TRZ43779.1 hypothetical protein DMZ48_10260 [Robertkochia solimangrovi]